MLNILFTFFENKVAKKYVDISPNTVEMKMIAINIVISYAEIVIAEKDNIKNNAPVGIAKDARYTTNENINKFTNLNAIMFLIIF